MVTSNPRLHSQIRRFGNFFRVETLLADPRENETVLAWIWTDAALVPSRIPLDGRTHWILRMICKAKVAYLAMKRLGWPFQHLMMLTLCHDFT